MSTWTFPITDHGACLEHVFVFPLTGSPKSLAFNTRALLDPSAYVSQVVESAVLRWPYVQGTLVHLVELKITAPDPWEPDLHFPEYRLLRRKEMPGGIGLILGRDFLKGRSSRRGSLSSRSSRSWLLRELER